jgi:hypothetical protein
MNESEVRCRPHTRFLLELILSFLTKSDTDEKISLVLLSPSTSGESSTEAFLRVVILFH